MRNDGSEAEADFKKKLEDKHGKAVFIEKYTDTKSVKREKGSKNYVKASPADFIVTLNGEMFWAEVKSCSSKTSFPFSQFTDSQRRAMVRQKAAGGKYWVFIYSIELKQWYMVSGPALLEIEKNEDRKSITWTELNALKWRI